MSTQSWSGKSAVFLMESALTSHGSSKSNKKPSDGRGISDYQLPCYWRIVTVEHVLPPKNAVFLMGSNPGPLAMEATALPTELKEISTKTVSRGGYEPIKYTTVPMTLCSGAFPLHSPPTSRVIIPSWRNLKYQHSTQPVFLFWLWWII